MALSEAHRAQLDGIVSKMVANGESDADIQFVVGDFKSKYDPTPSGGVKDFAEKATSALINTQPLAGAYNAVTQGNIGQKLAGETFNSSENILPAVIQGMAQTALLGQGNKILQPLFEENLDARTQQFKESAPTFFNLGQGAGLMTGLPKILGQGAAGLVGKGAQALGVGSKLTSFGQALAEGAAGGAAGEMGLNPNADAQELQKALITGAIGGGGVNILGQAVKGTGNILGSIGIGKKGAGKVVNENLPFSPTMEGLEDNIKAKISSLGQEKQKILSKSLEEVIPLPISSPAKLPGLSNPMTSQDLRKIASIYKRGQDKATTEFLEGIITQIDKGGGMNPVQADKLKSLLGDLSYSASTGNLKSGVLPDVLDDWRASLNDSLLSRLPQGSSNKVRVLNSQMEALYDPKRLAGKAQAKAPRFEFGTVLRDTIGQPAVFQTLHKLGGAVGTQGAARVGGYLTQNAMAEGKQTE